MIKTPKLLTFGVFFIDNAEIVYDGKQELNVIDTLSCDRTKKRYVCRNNSKRIQNNFLFYIFAYIKARFNAIGILLLKMFY